MRQRHAHGALRRIGDRHRVVEEDHDAVAGEALERAFVLHDQRGRSRRGTSPSTAITSSGSAVLGEGGEAAQVEEDDRDLAAVALQRIVGAAGDDQLGELRREEALQPADPLELAHAVGDALLERSVELGELALLAQHLVVERLDAQQRAHPRQQLGSG